MSVNLEFWSELRRRRNYVVIMFFAGPLLWIVLACLWRR